MAESGVVSFEDIGKSIMEKGGRVAKDLELITKLAEERRADLCDVCRERRDKYPRGLITIPDDEGNIWQVHFECVIALIKEFQKRQWCLR